VSRVPTITLENTSRPSSSVPKTWKPAALDENGGVNLARTFCWVCSNGASHGPNTARTAMMPSTATQTHQPCARSHVRTGRRGRAAASATTSTLIVRSPATQAGAQAGSRRAR